MKTIPDDRIAYVYILESGGFYKIGFSYDPLARARRLSTGSPLPIRIVHTLRTAFHESIEAKLHRRFRAKRIHGEWFDLSDSDVDYIKSLDRNGDTPEQVAEYEERDRQRRASIDPNAPRISLAEMVINQMTGRVSAQPTYRNE